MPIKTRVILQTPRTQYKGKLAAVLLYRIGEDVHESEFPPNYEQLSSTRKLMFLSRFLPASWVLRIVKERAHNRKNRSYTFKPGVAA